MELPVLDGNPADPEEARREALAERLGTSIRGEIRIDAHHRRLYATDASIYEAVPIAVVIPRERSDIAATISACASLELPVLGRGAGTSLAGQSVAQAVVIDCSVHLDEITSITRNGTSGGEAVVDPGVVLDALQVRANQEHLAFGPDVATSTHATLGGMIMNCSAGSYSLVYGMTDEHVLGLDVVLSDGTRLHLDEGASAGDARVQALTEGVASIVLPLADEITQRFPSVRRNVGGYALDDILSQFRASNPGTFDKVNLARLICGSEGTLAFLERARLRLVPLPRHTCTAVLRFESIAAAMSAVQPILGTDPAAVELIDEHILTAAAAQPIYAEDVATLLSLKGRIPAAVLYVSWFLEESGEAEGRFEKLEAAVPDSDMIRIRDEAHAERLWSIRKVGLGLISKSVGTYIPMPGLEDCAVGAEQLPGFIEEFDRLLSRHGREAVHYAHASVGLLHLRPRIDVASAEDRADFLAMGREVLELVRAHGGSISGEHGDGRIRSELMQTFYGERLVEAFRAVKRLFDPAGLLNPGDKVEVRDPMGSLRSAITSPQGDQPTFETSFSFEEEGSFALAAAACDGNGLCRRARGGAMCPSYRVTREERHATRGRANALAAAIRGELDMNDPELHETFSLCVSCKACRHECPSNVDVARLKSEYLAHRWKGRRAPLADVLMGKVFHVVNRSATVLPWFSNAVSQWGPTRWMISKMLGVSTARTLPRFARTLQGRMLRRRSALDRSAPAVLLFPDCFNNCNEPENGIAAVELLEAFGYRVILPKGRVCCGRAAISGGFLPTACDLVLRSAKVLSDVLEREQVVGIIALEPSCASALREEWLELRTSVPRKDLERIAAMTDVLEGFLLDGWESHPITPDFEIPKDDLLVHQHCHMKHTGNRIGVLLERCLGRPVAVVDSGCCGMAGSFGYRAENQEISFAMAEDSLGRFLDDFQGTVVAPGTSCRQQVKDVFAARTLHPAVCLRDQLVKTVTR